MSYNKRVSRKSLIKILFVIFFLFLCVCISFCINKPKDENTVHIQYATWGSKSEVDIIKPILKDFETKNPDVKIDFMHIPQNYFQKIHLLFASNTSPDVIFINNLNLPIYANAGLLEELQPKEEFYPQAVKALTFNGKIYAIPRDVSNLVIFYNKDLFDKKHLAYPKSNWTFDEFLKTAQALTDNDTFGISFEEEPLFYLPYLMSEGGGILPDEITKTESQSALNFYADLRKKYHVAPLKSESASATMGQMFLQKRLGMYLSGRWMVPKLKEEADFNWDIIQFPAGSNGSVVQLDASGWAIAKTSKHKEEALKFVEFLSSKENIEKMTKSGLIVPARLDCADIISQEKYPEHSSVFTEIIEISKPTPVTTNYREIVDNLKKDMESRFN